MSFLSLANANSMTPPSLHLNSSSLNTCAFFCFATSPRLLHRFRRRRLSCYAAHNEEGSDIGVDTLHEFIQLNVGSWKGSFTNYDAQGNALHYIPTHLAAHSYGRGDQVSLYQTLNIKQPPSKTFISGEDTKDSEWTDLKLDEINLLTIEKQQQVVYFPRDRAYAISHRTAEMLDKVMRAGVLGDDGDDMDEAPPGVKLPSRRPALVCESCLYSENGEDRMRGFHVLDSRGLLDFIGVFQENKNQGFLPEIKEPAIQDDPQSRLGALLGCWSGHSVTRRTGVYGSTVVEDDISVTYSMKNDEILMQNIKTSKGSILLTGAAYGSLLKFEKGLHTTLLPGGLAFTAPVNVGQSVGRSQSFYFEFSWLYGPGKRRRLVRTYDTDGLVVSSTFVNEAKI